MDELALEFAEYHPRNCWCKSCELECFEAYNNAQKLPMWLLQQVDKALYTELKGMLDIA